jgi:hypothetical protein
MYLINYPCRFGTARADRVAAKRILMWFFYHTGQNILIHFMLPDRMRSAACCMRAASQLIKGNQVMKRIIIAALLSVFVAAPAVAADGKNSVGVNYGTDLNGVFGIQGEFDISSMTNKQPISVQVFWKKSSQTFYGVSADTTALGVAGIYDFNALAKLDKKIHPYAGAGLKHVTDTAVSPAIPPFIPSMSIKTTSTDVYVTGGVRYYLTPQFDADLSYNNFGGLTFGANFDF